MSMMDLPDTEESYCLDTHLSRWRHLSPSTEAELGLWQSCSSVLRRGWGISCEWTWAALFAQLINSLKSSETCPEHFGLETAMQKCIKTSFVFTLSLTVAVWQIFSFDILKYLFDCFIQICHRISLFPFSSQKWFIPYKIILRCYQRTKHFLKNLICIMFICECIFIFLGSIFWNSFRFTGEYRR